MILAVLAAGCSLLAACSDDKDSNSSATTAVITTLDTGSTTASSAAPTTVDIASQWETVVAPADCMCSDGSPFQYFVREADPTKVLFFMEGGGACFSAETCGPDSESYKKTAGDGPLGEAAGQGIFDFSNPANPFADYSIVFVPYCTGDVHIGNTTTDYGDGVVVHHNGYVNGTTALAAMAELFPDVTKLVVAGESGGSIPSPLYAGLAHDLLPNAGITVLADGSGAYPDVPAINALIGSQWGTMNAIPAWPETAGVTVETWSLPGLFIVAGKHDPAILFARHDYAFDHTQVAFAGLAGIPADDLVSLIDSNEAAIEATGISQWSYTSPGDAHTVLHKPDFYTETVNGVQLVDWVWALLAGDTMADVHCTECTTA